MPETRSQQLMKSNKLSPDLAAIVGKTEASRIELIKLLGAYLKESKLECEDNKQFFLPDEKMAKVFGTEKIQGFSMAKRIQAHLTPIDTIDGSGDVENDSGGIAGDSDDFEVTFKFPVNDPDDLEIIFQKQPKKQEPKQGGDDSNQDSKQGDDDSNQEPKQVGDDSNQELKQGDDSDARGANYTHHINACPPEFENFKASLDDDSYEEAYDLAAIEQWKIDGDSRNINKIHRLKRIILACLPGAEGVKNDATYTKK